MKKFLLIIIFLLVIAAGAWAGATYLFGSQTSAWVMSEMEKLRLQSGTASVIDMDQTSYTPGFFSSQATTKIRAANPMMGGGDGLKLKHVVYHGPLAMTPDGIKVGSNYMVTTIDREDFPDEVNNIIEKGFGGKEPLTLTINGGFGESIDGEVKVAAFSLDAAEFGQEGRIEFAGLTGDYRLSSANGSINVDIGKLKVEGEDVGEEFSLEMEPATIRSDMRQMIDGKLTVEGDGSILFPKFTYTGDGVTVRINDLAMNSEVRPSGSEDLKGKMELSVGEVKLPAQAEFDPMRPIVANGARIDVDFSGMNIAALGELVEAQERMQKAQADMMSKGTSEMTPESFGKVQKEAMAYMKSVFDLFQKDFGMGMGLSLGEGAGKSNVSVSMKFVKDGKATDLKTIGELISAIDAEAKLHVDKSLVPPEQVMQLREPIAQGIILDKGTHYEAVIKLSNGALDMNGKPMPLLEQMGPAADQPIPWEKMSAGGAGGVF